MIIDEGRGDHGRDHGRDHDDDGGVLAKIQLRLQFQ